MLFLGHNGFGAAVPAPPSPVTLAWNPSPSAGIAGYRLYLGTTSQNYTNTIDVGSLTSVTVSNLLPGITYFFAVTAYDTIGLESPFSGEVSYTVPGSAWLNLAVSPLTGVLLTGTVPVGSHYDILRTGDLRNWVRVGSVVADSLGAFRFTEALNPGARFYRLIETSP